MLSALTRRLRRPVESEAAPPEDPARGLLAPETPAAPLERPLERPLARPFRIAVAEGGETLFAQDFEAGSFVVGASPEADIIIPDLDEPEAASITLETVGAACLVTLTALAPGVSARGRTLAVGRPVLFPERARFAVGAYAFDVAFTPPRRAIVIDRKALPAVLVAGGLVLGLFGVVLGGASPVPAPAPGQAMAASDAAGADADLLRPAALPAPADPAVRLAEAADALRLAFVSANLVPQLRVGADASRVLVEGDVTPEERARAMEVIAGFRERHAAPIELALASDARDADFFTTVVLEPETFLIGADGRRYGPSQRLPNGAEIVAIEEASVLLEHEGVRQRVFYGL